jgi:hypothetical protein
MENSNPDVSIMLPAFNDGDILGNGVHKINAGNTADDQTFEILVIDYV